jgi:hypothetical protein
METSLLALRPFSERQKCLMISFNEDSDCFDGSYFICLFPVSLKQKGEEKGSRIMMLVWSSPLGMLAVCLEGFRMTIKTVRAISRSHRTESFSR